MPATRWTRARRFLFSAAMVPLLSSCVSLTGIDDDDERDLERNRRRWESYGVFDYDYTVQRHCFCGSEVTEPVRVRVRSGQVVDQRYISDGFPVPYQFRHLFPSVDGLFDLAEDAVFSEAYRLDVRYQSAYNFPREIDIDYRRNVADDEVYIESYDFVER